MASCWRNRYSRDGLCRPCRASTYLESVVPALKRWAIVTAPPCESFYPALKRWAIFELQRRHARRSRLAIIEHALKVRFSNHKLNKSRGGKVERLVNFSNNYEKNSLCINHACLCCIRSSAGDKSGRFDRFFLQQSFRG